MEQQGKKRERDKSTIPQLWPEISTFNKQPNTNTNWQERISQSLFRMTEWIFYTSFFDFKMISIGLLLFL